MTAKRLLGIAVEYGSISQGLAESILGMMARTDSPGFDITDVRDRSGKLIARFMNLDNGGSASEFLTPPDLGLQIGVIVHEEGYAVRAHSHRPLSEPPPDRCEFLAVQRGECVVTVYDDEGLQLIKRSLKKGEAVLLIAGGHAVRMTTETTLLEIKQGPYDGPLEVHHLE